MQCNNNLGQKPGDARYDVAEIAAGLRSLDLRNGIAGGAFHILGPFQCDTQTRLAENAAGLCGDDIHVFLAGGFLSMMEACDARSWADY